MKRYKLLLISLIIPFVTLSAQSALFPMSSVRLLPSRFQDNFKRDSAWMMSIPVPSLLHSFQTTSGAYAGKEGGYMTVRKLGGWESMDCDLRGHITGHLLSALATLYAQTNSEAVKAKADSIVNGLNVVQHAYGNTGYLSAFGEGLINRNIEGKSVWAPWYTLHKILQGLIDQYTLCGNDTALAIAKRMGLWAYNKTKDLSEETRKRMLRNEFGGFNDAMYQLYGLTKDERYLKTARFFYDAAKIDPLKHGDDNLGSNHANTFIPKLIGGHDGNNDLFVNLLIPSRLTWQGTTLTQTTNFPQSGTTTLTFTGKPRRYNVHLRRPAWASSVSVKVNGKKAKDIVWKKNDIIIPPMPSAPSKHSATKEGKEIIEVTYGMALHEEATKDDPNRFAVLYGPIVLSGKLQKVAHPFSDPKKYNDYYTYNYNIPSTVAKDGLLNGIKSLKKVGPLEYVTPNGIRLHPFYDAHHERYVVYWQR